MHSLFSRSRTNSTPKKPQVDEFGAISSPSSKKSKKKQANLPPPPEPQLPDNSFLPTHLDRPRDEFGGFQPPKDYDYGYLSYERHVVLGIQDVARLVEVLTHELVTRGGITTPFIFSSSALDISPSAVKRLISLFLETCKSGVPLGKADKRWREEARFAGPHDLGMCLRWGLARAMRIQGGQEVRGLLPWDMYRQFKETEAATGYSPSHFSTILDDLIPPLRSVILTIFSLLTRLTANSASSGHTPPTLSTLFGPLFFGLGPQLRLQTFQGSYTQYLEAANATEHLILAFIRWQDFPTGRPGTATSAVDFGGDLQARDLANNASFGTLGVPTRLKEWIKGYPSMLNNISFSSTRNGHPQARRGARTVRVVSVRRNVRVYSADLVKSGASWGYVPPSARLNPNSFNALASSKEWQRITPPGMKLPPRYSESYKKRMNMHSSVVPEFGPGPSSSATSSPTSISTTPSFTSTMSSATSLDSMNISLGSREGEDRFRSLTDLKWGEFESMGFGGLGADGEAERKLQFDLTESARMSRSEKRATLSWTDFSSAGFSRADDPLSTTLQFSTPIVSSMSSWSVREAELTKKLRKAQQQSNKNMPAFDWDTEPILGGEEVVEEGFVDVFCDLVCGSGWLEVELERAASESFSPVSGATTREGDWSLLDQECNWALVEFRSLPHSRSPATDSSPLSTSLSSSTQSSSLDPRSAATLILFEEFIPLEYRQKLRAALGSSSRRRLPSLFSSASQATIPSPSKNKQWKTTPSVANGRGYAAPLTPSRHDAEFDSMLRGGSVTKVISLSGGGARSITTSPLPVSLSDRSSTPRPQGIPQLYTRDEARDGESPPPPPPSSAKKSRFKFPTGLPVSPLPAKKGTYPPAEYSSVEFETRLASYSDEERNSGGDGVTDEAEKQKRRQSRDDAWVDILVATHNRRMGGQEAEIRAPGERRRRVGPDPELASLEVAQVLASVQQERSMSPLSDDELERRFGAKEGEAPVSQPISVFESLQDADVDEIQTVPRTRETLVESIDDRDTLEYASSLDAEPVMEPVMDPTPEEVVLPPRKGLGYFDLHPDRRPALNSPEDDEDPRHRLAYMDSDDEGGNDNEPVTLPQAAEVLLQPVAPLRPLPKVPPVQAVSPVASPAVSPLNPKPKPAQSEIPTNIKVEQANLAQRDPSRSKVELPRIPTASPVTNDQHHGNGISNGHATEVVADKAPLGTKTAALIEMYRERERSVSPNPSTLPPAPISAPVIQPPSRLPVPVRAPVLAKDTVPAAIPTTILAPQQIAAPAHVPVDLSPVEPPRVVIEETGRASPARYVHGAPLHNVMEEEEEEDA
ncbi:hypothetical protein BDN71DRAFT_1506671 [Pleurotus eryngii]|uniref:Meiotically up-regulated protein Msb1/Mug8 domain-containing protein n=1 Tax=Pleurotus eryngii TaxID=5323 RepID=A0A9P6DFM3_PLEER|nr:hypothetical protein BDN71DRAFT_1506671 [Pleurotus eryngii]